MPNDWTSSETISSPDQITINWKAKPAGSTTVVDKSVKLQSTTKSTSRTDYQTFAYNDTEGKLQTQDVAVFKRDVKTATIASVNSAYVTYRVQNALGLPPGNAENVSETTTEYAITIEGPVKIRDTTIEQISYVQFVGGLALPSYEGYFPGTDLVVANKTVVEYENVRTATGRDMTRTKTSRWIAQGLSQEGQQSAKDVLALVDGLNGTAGNPDLFDDVIQTYIPLVFEGTEVQTSTGREPVPARPSEQDSIKDEVVNGDTNPDDTTITPEEKYGNEAWTKYVPAGTDYNTLKGDTNGDGVPDWAPYVPQDYTDYDQDSDSDGVPDWAPYVPTSWEDLNQDSSGDGIPDWAPFVPTQWQDYDQDTSGDGVPDWAPYVPQGWQDYIGDSNNDGVPDWAPYVPGNWQDFNQDTNGDGVPDWAPYVPAGWEDFDQDTNNDGTPDWAPYVPIDWQDFDKDSNGDGTPDWAPYVPTDWEDYDTDTDNDGTPDWAPYVPTGWEDFDTKDTDYTTDTVTVDNTKTITGVVRFDGSAYDSTEDTTTATYEMPYAPDSYFQILQGQRVLTPGGARVAAEAFGITQSALDIGHAYGQNIVSGFNEIPSDDLSPLYLRVAGIEGAFLCDSVSYAWGPEGMVVSSDLMLLGVTGYYGSSAPATSWLRLPVASTGLTAAGATTVEANPVKANSIVIPNDFSGATPAPTLAQLPVNGQDVFAEWRQGANIIGPTLAVEILTAFSGPYLSSREFEYALTLEAETAAVASGPIAVLEEFSAVRPPGSVIALAALLPVVITGASVAAPVGTVTVAASAPAVSSGASAQAPAAVMLVAGLLPEMVGRQKTIVTCPAAAVTVAGSAPTVSRGARVQVPAASVTIAAVPLTIYDADALKYMSSVEAADGQALEVAIKDAIDVFVRGCKADGIWTAIKASCILAGARTLNGALVSLKGTAPANNGFVNNDYNRKTGLIGNSSSKYLDSSRANNADPQDSQHLSAYMSTGQPASLGGIIGNAKTNGSYIYDEASTWFMSRGGAEFSATGSDTSLAGLSRSAGSSFVSRKNGVSTTRTQASASPNSDNIFVFALNGASGAYLFSGSRLAFYSIGESIDLAKLNARVSTLVAAYSAAI